MMLITCLRSQASVKDRMEGQSCCFPSSALFQSSPLGGMEKPRLTQVLGSLSDSEYMSAAGSSHLRVSSARFKDKFSRKGAFSMLSRSQEMPGAPCVFHPDTAQTICHRGQLGSGQLGR